MLKSITLFHVNGSIMLSDVIKYFSQRNITPDNICQIPIYGEEADTLFISSDNLASMDFDGIYDDYFIAMASIQQAYMDGDFSFMKDNGITHDMIRFIDNDIILTKNSIQITLIDGAKDIPNEKRNEYRKLMSFKHQVIGGVMLLLKDLKLNVKDENNEKVILTNFNEECYINCKSIEIEINFNQIKPVVDWVNITYYDSNLDYYKATSDDLEVIMERFECCIDRNRLLDILEIDSISFFVNDGTDINTLTWMLVGRYTK